MKKIVSALISIVFLSNVAFAYTSTVLIKGVKITLTSEEGGLVQLDSYLPEVTGWKVKQGNVTIVNNEFTMPREDVVIEAIIPNDSTHLLKLDFPYFTNEERRAAGEIITVEAVSESNYVFKKWTAIGVSLTADQLYSPAITFTMPANGVTLVANYEEEIYPNTEAPYTITAISNEGTSVEGVFSNHKCDKCGGKDHQCEVVNILIDEGHSVVVEVNR